MDDALANAQTIRLLSHTDIQLIINMVTVITAILLTLYDHACTLDKEYNDKHIWNKPWNSSKVLFIAKQIWNIRLAIQEIYTLSFNTIPLSSFIVVAVLYTSIATIHIH
ncbi:hypothetical protein BDQ17DRAFT_1327737 [Cyathus striatus]|nr:hypothetical protein BDQ17DRAFT_1327737 [Cyathus striatus]